MSGNGGNHPVVAFFAIDACLAHVDNDGASTLDDIAIDDGGVPLELILSKAALVDDLHLFDNGALSGLS
jgi:hypothetical protein